MSKTHKRYIHDGANVGFNDGEIVGGTLGAIEGDNDGTLEGISVGGCVGAIDGAKDGEYVGVAAE